MKQLVIRIFILVALFSITIPSHANQKYIALQDGSIIKGEVIKLEDGIYTVQTSTLGEISIEDADILSITSHLTEAVPESNDSSNALKQQVQQIQQELINDEEIMEDVKEVMSNKDVINILSDPELMNDILSFDANKIKSNQKINELMQNPEMQNLIEKIDQRLQANE